MRFLPFILLLLLGSCGKEDTGKKTEDGEVVRIDGSNVQGVYQTPLTAVNFNTTLGVVGAAGLYRSSDTFKAFVKLYIGEKGVTHIQNVHLGGRCPTLADDINGDGYIDYREALFVVGNVILPLDDDIGNQRGGRNLLPVGNGMAGGYFYERTTSFQRMYEDLHDADDDTLDLVDKLPFNRGISFHQKVVLVHGVGNYPYLPDSVNTGNGLSQRASLPIACGVLARSSKFPAELYDRSDPLTRPERVPTVVIHPRTPAHREPDVITPFPDPDPPARRRGSIRSRFRRWVRDTFGDGGDDDGDGQQPTE